MVYSLNKITQSNNFLKKSEKILETKDVVIFISKAGYTIYFEKKNASSEDIERLHAFFDKQNITWKKSIL